MSGPGRADVVAEARRWIGTPYVHQASARGAGTDCLGLILGVWRRVVGRAPGQVPAYTADWSESTGEETLRAAAERHLLARHGHELVAGDVILFRMRRASVAKHLGIIGAAGSRPSFIHAYDGHGVVESPLSAPWLRRIAGRYGFPERMV